jgi:hypothetical protein
VISAHLFEIGYAGYAAWGCAATVTASLHQCRGWIATVRGCVTGLTRLGYAGYAGTLF